MLCILSPVCLFLMGGASEAAALPFNESFAGFCGLVVLFVMIAIAVAIFLLVGAKHSPYAFLETGDFELAYGVSGMVKEKQKAFRDTYVKCNIIGTCLCILSPIVLLLGIFTVDHLLSAYLLSGMFVMIAVSVGCFITVGVRWASMERLLQEGEFASKDKHESKLVSTITTVYWLLATAVYLIWSFASSKWGITWILWPIAGILHAAVMEIVNLFEKKDEK